MDRSVLDMTKQEVIKSLKSQRCRITNQRMMILDTILEGECTSCKEIYYKVKKKNPGIGVATVYRMINTLETIGAIGRKKEYLIKSNNKEDEDMIYRIRLEDQTEVELTDKMWKQVIMSGLKSCGILNNSNLKISEISGVL